MVAVALVSAVAACDATPEAAPTGTTVSAPTGPQVSTSPGEFPVPPLRLPSVAPGAACPVTESQPWANPDQAPRVIGSGPLYPIASYFPDNALPLRDRDRDQDDSYTVKARWLAAGYTGPVLVRVGRIDGPGSASMQFSYLGESRDDGHHAVLTNPDTDLPATTTVSGPGCYAYQVDGTSFTYTIVFRATPAPS